MSARNVSATARVQVTLEVTVGSTWDDDCQVGQIYKQATVEALAALDKVLPGRIRIVGTPLVTAVAVEAERC